MTKPENEKILILDFGSQYTQLIARRVREQKVFCEIVPYTISEKKIQSIRPKGLILSGGPSSVYAQGAPLPAKVIFNLGIPILGICYGLQIIAHLLGGTVRNAFQREYGYAKFISDDNSDLFHGLESPIDVWMSHGDHLLVLPSGFAKLGHTENAPIAAVKNKQKKIYGIQFHPEVIHTPKGGEILRNFLYGICDCTGQWTPKRFVESAVNQIRDQVQNGKVLCALSGGVDSAVTAVLMHRAVGDRLIPIFVDNGVLRKGEAEEVIRSFQNLNLRFVDASEQFLHDLQGITDPEEKRKAIGRRFIQVFEDEAEKLGKIDFLAQGTLYPDVIESTSTWGPSATIKSHHNVGGVTGKDAFETY